MLKQFFIVILFVTQLTLSADSASRQLQIIKEKLNVEQSISDYAISVNNRFVLVARKQTQKLELLNAADLNLIKVVSVKELTAHNNKIDFIFSANSRQSFIVGIGSSNHLLEVIYEENPLPVYNGVMHDYRLGEGLVRDQSHFPIRIIKPAGKTNIPITSYYFYSLKGLLFIARDKTVEVIQLDARQSIATMTFEDIPNLNQSRIQTNKTDSLAEQDRSTLYLLVPFFDKQGITSINMNSWETTIVK